MLASWLNTRLDVEHMEIKLYVESMVYYHQICHYIDEFIALFEFSPRCCRLYIILLEMI